MSDKWLNEAIPAEGTRERLWARVREYGDELPLSTVIDFIITECSIEGLSLDDAGGRAILRSMLWEATDSADAALREKDAQLANALSAADYWHAQYDAQIAARAQLPPDPRLLQQMIDHTALPERVRVPVRCGACGWEDVDAVLDADAVRPFWQLTVDNLALVEMVRRLCVKWMHANMETVALEQAVRACVSPDVFAHIVSGPHRPDEWMEREGKGDHE